MIVQHTLARLHVRTVIINTHLHGMPKTHAGELLTSEPCDEEARRDFMAQWHEARERLQHLWAVRS